MGKSLRQQADEATEYVLDHWKGTPEELGATVYDAVYLTPEPYASKEFNERVRREMGVARQRLYTTKGGRELLELENRLKLNAVFKKPGDEP